MGIQGVQLAKAMGYRAIVIDGGQKKKDLALSMGAEAFIDFTATEDVAGDVIKVSRKTTFHNVLPIPQIRIC